MTNLSAFTPEKKQETMESIICFIAQEYKEDIKSFKTINCIGLLMRSVLYGTIKIVNERFTSENTSLVVREEASLTKDLKLNKIQGDGKVSNLVKILNQDGQLVVTSRQISEDFGKEHSSVVIRAIENLIKELKGSGQNCTHLFIPSEYVNQQNKQVYKEYLLTRDGFSLLVMGFTGAKALEWKLKYIEAFNKMEEELKQKMIDTSQLSPELQMFNKLFNSLAEQELATKQISAAIQETKQEIQSMREVVAINSMDWRKDTSSLISKMAVKLGGFEHINKLREESYEILKSRISIDLKTRITNKRRRMAEEGVCKSKRDKVNNLDIIGEDKKALEVYLAIIKEMAIKYGAA